MGPLRFVWDERKNTINKKKQGVSFEEGRTVFDDDNALLMHDPNHSLEEDRFLLLGLSSVARLLVVSHCYRDPSDIVRIISTWKATKSESSQYAWRFQP